MFEQNAVGVSPYRSAALSQRDRHAATARVRVLLLGLVLPHAVSTLRGNIAGFAERQPDRLCGEAGSNSLLGGSPAQIFKDQVMGENAAVTVAKLIRHCYPKLANPHGSTVIDNRRVGIRQAPFQPTPTNNTVHAAFPESILLNGQKGSRTRYRKCPRRSGSIFEIG